jgi:hypothetical protein
VTIEQENKRQFGRNSKVQRNSKDFGQGKDQQQHKQQNNRSNYNKQNYDGEYPETLLFLFMIAFAFPRFKY